MKSPRRLAVAVPSNPADAAGLMLSALAHPGPAVYLEHKLLADYWLDYLGGGGRDSVSFDVPAAGARGEVADPPARVPIGEATTRREGDDVTIVSIGVGVHRALEAAETLAAGGVESAVVDLRSAAPLDRDSILDSAARTERVLVVDEDYRRGGLSGEVAATLAEAGVRPGLRPRDHRGDAAVLARARGPDAAELLARGDRAGRDRLNDASRLRPAG